MTATSLPPHKQGDRYLLTCTYKVAGVATDVTSITIRCQIRTGSGKLVDTLTITKDADQVTNPGKFTITKTGAEVAEWPPGVHKMDIEFTTDGEPHSTETFFQPIIEDVTR